MNWSDGTPRSTGNAFDTFNIPAISKRATDIADEKLRNSFPLSDHEKDFAKKFWHACFSKAFADMTNPPTQLRSASVTRTMRVNRWIAPDTNKQASADKTAKLKGKP